MYFFATTEIKKTSISRLVVFKNREGDERVRGERLIWLSNKEKKFFFIVGGYNSINNIDNNINTKTQKKL